MRAMTCRFWVNVVALRVVAASALLALMAGCGPAASDRAGSQGDGQIPPPRAVRTGQYQVGAYYFPGWPTLDKWKVLDRFPERMPFLGYYREGDPAVMDWQIRWAVEHGVSFFAFDWYWDRGQRQLEHALHDGYLRARFRRFMKFCLLWANHNPAGSSSEADLLALVDYWIAHYFRRPEYLLLDGKPVVIVFSPRHLRDDMGTDAVRAAFVKMRARVEAAGLPGIFIMGGGAGEPGRPRRARARGLRCGYGLQLSTRRYA
jgi:Glycosyltransferase WbsX